MNRRAFLRALGVGAGAIVAAPYLPMLPTPRCIVGSKYLYARITFKGIPVVYDPHCPPGKVYFLDAMNLELRALVEDIASR